MTHPPPARPSREAIILAASVAVVLADSSIVTLGLPDVLVEFEATVTGAAWVLIAFNAVLAVCLPPAAAFADRHGAERTWAVGLVLLAAASLLCAVAGSMAVLIAGRVGQAAGGAAVLAGAVGALRLRRGSEAAGAQVWGPAGVVGLAFGPAVGGLLTEVLSWKAIFAIQVPVVLLVVAVRPGWAGRRSPAGGRTPVTVGLALALLSAASTAALFLLVLLLTRGWEYSPLQAAAVVSVIPIATLLAGRAARRLPADGWAAGAGIVATAGGLAALGLLPGAGWEWTIAPQVLIGLGLGLALPVLTSRALASGGRGRAGVGTLWARHAGVVAGLVLLVPLFSADLDGQREAAQRAGTALLLEARLPPSTKIELAEAIGAEIERADGRLPDLGPAFARVPVPEAAAADHADLRAAMEDELERAATQAFSRSFLVAAVLGLLTLAPLLASAATSSSVVPPRRRARA